MIRASGYVLLLSKERALTLLEHSPSGQSVGEPVPAFPGGKRAPILVIASFSPGAITHIADGRKGIASGTKLVRLNLENLQELTASIPVHRLLDKIPPRLQSAVLRRLDNGGQLSPAAFQSLIAALKELAPDTASRIARFDEKRGQAVARLSSEAKRILAQQKESVALALRISGLETRELLNWNPPLSGAPRSFLDGLPGVRVREDAMVAHDLGHVPGFAAVHDYPFAAKLFQKDDVRLTVVLANKLPLEEQFGTDLIYFNERFRAFVMVQYKAMEKIGNGKAEFRLPNAQLDIEIERMQTLKAALASIPNDPGRDAFRFHDCPFFLKLCSRQVFNPDDSGLFPGMYLPLDYWTRLVGDPATLGPRGGRLITFENVGRRLTESEFIPLVTGGWVGSGAAQSKLIDTTVREVLEYGKSVVLAVRHGSPVATP